MPELSDAEGRLRGALRRIENHTPFAEIVAERSLGDSVRLDRTSVSPRIFSRLEGAAFRAWAGDHWAEVASTGLSAEPIDRAAEALIGLLGDGAHVRPPPGESTTGDESFTQAPPKPMDELSIEDRIHLAQDWYAWATSVPGVPNTTVSMGFFSDERLYLNTAAARRHQRISRVFANVVPIAIEGGRIQYDVLGWGGVGGREVLDYITEERVHEVAKSARAMLAAEAPPTGSSTVLMDPSTTGTFAHESFGHGTEADQFVRERSYLRPILGSVVGPEFLTIADDGAYSGGWGGIYFDDEGRKSRKNLLVDHGRFTGVLHDRTSAARLGGAPTANARRADFLSREFVRMTNTYVEPGDWKVEELVKEAKEGILLERSTSGIEDPLGGQMQIKVLRGHRIEHGEITTLVSSMALSGRVLDVLRSVRGIGRAEDFKIDPGFCGKGHSDMLPTGTGGSYLLTSAAVGPA
ncbi:MAG: TldD/PmbA family protein [Thermoplasmata archaeon]